ncbi:MAG TPA: FAD-linked oxidase C-terminal domain-containing protein [Steroidobacteraceae bacterium]|nr:FAD-linked oxidase C-terminal domain-containing protein [Steroidobacteraceae bacterium]
MAPDPALVRKLRESLGKEAVLASAESCVAFDCDALTAHRRTPDLVVLPTDTAGVQAVLRIAAAHGTPVVARGAGTGLSGGALPVEGGILLVLSRLNRILEVDPRRRLARVQPGVTNLAVSDAAAPHGLFYAPDPSSQVACTIGGNVAENSGGVHCLKYGLTVHNLLEVVIATWDGELVTVGSPLGEAPGLSLLPLVTGSEGMLGVVVETTVRLVPVPERVELVLAAFDDVAACADAVGGIIAAGILPAGLEMMDGPAIRAVEAFVQCGYPVDAAAVLLCELDGLAHDVEAQLAETVELLRRGGATSLRVARDAAERARMWSGRKSAFPAVGRLAPDYYCMDGTIPRRQLAAVLARIAEMSREAGLAVANVFHAGDGNLHPLILFDAGQPGDLERAERLGAAILELCVAVGGTVTGEHGVGVEKLGPMCSQFGTPELEAFHSIKRAFDPHGRLNPGKAVPTLARCAEYGAMRVHGGKLPHAHLPRF